MKYFLLLICVLEAYYIIDLSLSGGLRNNVICVLFEGDVRSAFCRNFFEENTFVLTKTMIFRSIVLPFFLFLAAIGFGAFYFTKGRYRQGVKINLMFAVTGFIIFSLLVLGF